MTIPVLDPEVVALATVRAYCRWHVTPEVTEEMVLDGPSGDLLILPTLRLVDMADLIEDGVSVDLSTLELPSPRGLIRKRDGGWWTHRYGGIVTNVTHGFADAPDFYAAVQSYMERTSSGMSSGGPREAVGPFVFGAVDMAGDGSPFTKAEKSILDLYRLEPKP